jgi:hypothetical protein
MQVGDYRLTANVYAEVDEAPDQMIRLDSPDPAARQWLKFRVTDPRSRSEPPRRSHPARQPRRQIKMSQDLPWDELVDGKLWGFRRGRHYTGDMATVEREARAAAADRGKMAITLAEELGMVDYVWVQFVDGKVEPGEPCPRCGRRFLYKVQRYFARCKSCDSLHMLSAPSPGLRASEVGEIVALRLLSPEGNQLLPRAGSATLQPQDSAVDGSFSWRGDELAQHETAGPGTNIRWTIGLGPGEHNRRPRLT